MPSIIISPQINHIIEKTIQYAFNSMNLILKILDDEEAI